MITSTQWQRVSVRSMQSINLLYRIWSPWSKMKFEGNVRSPLSKRAVMSKRVVNNPIRSEQNNMNLGFNSSRRSKMRCRVTVIYSTIHDHHFVNVLPSHRCISHLSHHQWPRVLGTTNSNNSTPSKWRNHNLNPNNDNQRSNPKKLAERGRMNSSNDKPRSPTRSKHA